MRLFRLQAVLLLSLLLPAGLSAGEVKLNGQTFTLPDGFVIEQVAGTDLVQRPVSASFDDRGRLFVTDSSGSNAPPAEQLANPDHRLLCLEDTDGDGVFDRSTVFADKIMFPQGCLWHEGAIYVAGPPSLWKFTDADGDGVAEQREEWYQGGVLTGCANDVHGPVLGPDGFFYWTKGAFERLNLTDGQGKPINDRCSHVLRARPDGSEMESVARFGADNPSGIAFSPAGEPIVCATFLDLDQPGTRDGLVHAVYGGVFGKRNDVVDEAIVARTGDLLPVMTHLGAAAPADITRYDHAAFGPDYAGNFFTALFNLRKVTRHILEPAGSTYRTHDEDFVVSSAQDFHPTDVLPAPDGSLLILDTGGWYKLCCPTSQLAKPDVLGAIYRVRFVGNGGGDVPAVKAGDADARRRLKVASVHRNEAEAAAMIEILSEAAAAPKEVGAAKVRIAVEGLGRMHHRPAVEPILGVAALAADDRFLEHALIFALGEIGHAAPLRDVLASDQQPAMARRISLLALQIIGGDALAAVDLIPLLDAEDSALRDAAEFVVRRRPEWGGQLVTWFDRALREPDRDPGLLAPILAKLLNDPEMQQMAATLAADAEAPLPGRLAALQAAAIARPAEPVDAWAPALLAMLEQPTSTALNAAAALPGLQASHPSVAEALQKIANDPNAPAEIRLGALAATAGNLGTPSEQTFALLMAPFRTATAIEARQAAAEALARSELSADQRRELLTIIPTAGPLDLPRLLPCFNGGGDQALGEQLLAALRQAKSIRSVPAEVVTAALAAFPEPVRAEGEHLLLSLKQVNADQTSHLKETLQRIEQLEGDVRRGQTIFMSEQTACIACHQVGYLGGRLGPDLTSIGRIREKQDLLEAVLYPSASFVRTFEPVMVIRKKGDPIAGIVRSESPDSLVLATGPKEEVRIPRVEITDVRASSVSVMPDGLTQILSDQELADLIAFLKNAQ